MKNTFYLIKTTNLISILAKKFQKVSELLDSPLPQEGQEASERGDQSPEVYAHVGCSFLQCGGSVWALDGGHDVRRLHRLLWCESDERAGFWFPALIWLCSWYLSYASSFPTLNSLLTKVEKLNISYLLGKHWKNWISKKIKLILTFNRVSLRNWWVIHTQ